MWQQNWNCSGRHGAHAGFRKDSPQTRDKHTETLFKETLMMGNDKHLGGDDEGQTTGGENTANTENTSQRELKYR